MFARHLTSFLKTWLLMALAGCAALAPHRAEVPLPHFFRVDEHVYRGGQPTTDGFRQLAQMGVKTVINLRAEDARHQEEERRLVESLGMQWIYLPVRSYWKPSDAQILTFLEVARDPRGQPVFVHCRKGKERTGTLVAIYRIVQQGWEPARAYAEAQALGFSAWNVFMRHAIFKKYDRAISLQRPPSTSTLATGFTNP